MHQISLKYASMKIAQKPSKKFFRLQKKPELITLKIIKCRL
jgi:hypothetical protein